MNCNRNNGNYIYIENDWKMIDRLIDVNDCKIEIKMVINKRRIYDWKLDVFC